MDTQLTPEAARTAVEFWEAGVTMCITRCDELGRRLEAAYAQLDEYEYSGYPTERLDRMARLIESQEQEAVTRLEVVVRARNEAVRNLRLAEEDQNLGDAWPEPWY